jgi:hypothetical protein
VAHLERKDRSVWLDSRAGQVSLGWTASREIEVTLEFLALEDLENLVTREIADCLVFTIFKLTH